MCLAQKSHIREDISKTFYSFNYTLVLRGLFDIHRCFTSERIYTRHDGRLWQIYPVTTGLQRTSRQRWCNSHQGSHRLEKFLNLEGFLEKSLKIKYALKSTGKSLQTLKSPWILLFSVGLNTVDLDQNLHKIVVPLFGAANAAPNKGTAILCLFSSINFSMISF